MNRIRAHCWSITINNPTANDEKLIKELEQYSWFKEFKSQLEKGSAGTPHIQGCLTTSRVDINNIKKALPRAHIEPARSKLALAKYVEKAETREETRDTVVRQVMTVFEAHEYIARFINARWDIKNLYDKEFDWYCHQTPGYKIMFPMPTIQEFVHKWYKRAISEMIQSGMLGVEFIATNPMIDNVWRQYGVDILIRQEFKGIDNII